MKPITRPHSIKARIKPEVYKVLKELSAMTGETMSTTVNDLLEGLLPGLLETLHYMQEVKNMDAQAKASLASAFSQRANVLDKAVKETIQLAKDDIRQHKLPL